MWYTLPTSNSKIGVVEVKIRTQADIILSNLYDMMVNGDGTLTVEIVNDIEEAAANHMTYEEFCRALAYLVNKGYITGSVSYNPHAEAGDHKRTFTLTAAGIDHIE